MPTLSTVFDSSLVVIRDTNMSPTPTVSVQDSSIAVETTSLKIIVSKFPVRLAFYDASNRLLTSEPAAGGIGYESSNRYAGFTVGSTEHFYGTGERGMSFDLRGYAFDSYNTQSGGYGSPPPFAMNVNVPFIVSSNDYGVYFEDTYKGHFQIGTSPASPLIYTAYGGELSYYFIHGNTMEDVLSNYAWLTGSAPLLPKWAYGYIQSKFGYHDEAAAQAMITHMRNDSIPCDAIILDLYWFQYMGDLSWYTQNWPNPSQITANFLSQGFKTIVITEPYIAQYSPNYAVAVDDGYLAKNTSYQSYVLSNWWSCGCNAGLLDITNHDAQSWWWSKYNAIFGTGVAALWTDLGEPERDYPDMQFSLGPDARIHNIYDFLWAKTLFDGYNVAYPNKRLFNLTRSGYAGIQRFNVVTWSGDVSKSFGGLAVQLPFLLNMGMSGIPYHNSDIGGFDAGVGTAELYTRWMEFGAFCPVMRAHGYDIDNDTEPWAFGSTTESIVRNIIRLRYSLLPYNYTMAHETYASGIPLARPLVLAYPSDQNVVNESNAYMWGDDFIVAPVVQSGQTTQSFYLPAGKWIDYLTDKVYYGGSLVTMPAPIDQVPLLVRSGSVIPTQTPHDYIDEYPADTLTLVVYPEQGTISSFDLYEDDGKTLDYQSGAYATTHIEGDWTQTGNANNFKLTIGPSVGSYDGKISFRTYLCQIHKLSYDPSEVYLGNSNLIQYQSIDSLMGRQSGYYYNGVSGILYIKAPTNTDTSCVVTVDSVEVTGVQTKPSLPTGYLLQQNYPNPFNPNTKILFEVPSAQNVSLVIFDSVGRKVETLVHGFIEAGEHEVVFDGNGLASGVYYYRLTAGNFHQTNSMMLLK